MTLLENFKNRLIANKRIESTAYQYVNLVDNFLKDQNISVPEEVNTDNIAAYTAKLKIAGKDGRAKNFIHAIHAFLKLFQVNNATTPTTQKYIRKRDPQPFTKEELRAICQYIHENPSDFGGSVKSLRYIVAICVEAATGMRVEDLCALDRMQFRNGEYLRYFSKKKKKWISFRLPKWLRVLVGNYFDAEQLKNENSNAFNISRKMVERALKRAVEVHECLGPGRRAYPHLLRHSNINILHDAGASLKDIAETVGHADIKHTETYITMNEKSRMDRVAPKLEAMKLFKMSKG